MIINGKRHPGKNLVEKFLNYFDFSNDEAKHFERLVSYQKSLKTNPHLTMVIAPSTDEEKQEPIGLSFQTFMIRELLNGVSTHSPLDYIQKRVQFDLKKEEIESSLNYLFEKQLLENSNNAYKAIGNFFEGLTSSKEQIFKFHKSTMDNVTNAYLETLPTERSFHTSFLSIKEDKFQEAVEALKEFQHKFTELVDEENQNNRTFIFNMNFFPITKKD